MGVTRWTRHSCQDPAHGQRSCARPHGHRLLLGPGGEDEALLPGGADTRCAVTHSLEDEGHRLLPVLPLERQRPREHLELQSNTEKCAFVNLSQILINGAQ